MKFLCFTTEENFVSLKLGESLKFSGIVKAKPEDINQYDNTYEKIIEILQFENESKILKENIKGLYNFNNFQEKNKVDNLKKNSKDAENMANLNKFITDNKNKFYKEEQNNKPTFIDFHNDILSKNFFFAKYKINSMDLIKFQKLSNYKCLSSFLMISILDNKNFTNFEFLNILLFNYAFSKGTDLSINIFDLTKTDNVTNQIKNIYFILSNLEANYFNFNNDNKSNEDFIISKDIKNNRNNFKPDNSNFELNFGEIFSKKENFLLLDQVPLNLNSNISSFLNYSKLTKAFGSSLNLGLSENSINHSLDFSGINSIVISSKITNLAFKSQELINSSLFQLVNFYDINYFYTDRLDSDKDRKKTNQILKNEFENINNSVKDDNWAKNNSSNGNKNNSFTSGKKGKINHLNFNNKRKYSQFENENTQINNTTCAFTNSEKYYGYKINNADEIIQLDDLNYFSFLNEKIKHDLKIIHSDSFLSNLLNSNYEENYPMQSANQSNNKHNNNLFNLNNNNKITSSNLSANENSVKVLLSKYLIFVNNFLFPRIDSDVYFEIILLSRSLEEIFYAIKTNEFFEFPNIEKLMIKFCFIRARIDMRNKVFMSDVFESFLFIKEYLSLTFTFCLSNRKEMFNKNKKTKLNFVMEKIKQLCELENRKTFTKKEMENFCEEINLIDDLDVIIETLNFNGFMIKVNSTEYKLN